MLAGTAPANTVLPAITGTQQVFSTLTVSNGTWSNSPQSFARQWQTSADGSTGWTNISGATGSTYALVAGDHGKFIRCVVTATNLAGSTAANTTATAQITTPVPVNSAVPTVSGSAIVGQVLTTTNGTWTNTPTGFTYKWQTSANGTTGWTDISGATATTYTVVSGDANQFLRSVVTASNAGGAGTAANSAATSQVSAIGPDVSLVASTMLLLDTVAPANGNTTATSFPTGSATVNASHTVGSGTNRALVFFFGGDDNGTTASVSNPTITATFGGASITMIDYSYNANARCWTGIGILLNPSSGSGTLSVTVSAAQRALACAVAEFNNVKQTSPMVTPAIGGAGGTTSNVTTLTATSGAGNTSTAGSAVVSLAVVSQRAGAPTADLSMSAGTLLQAGHTGTTDLSDTWIGCGYEIKATVGTPSQIYNWTTASRGMARAYELLKA